MATASEMGWPSMKEFYAHRDVFITGATGFMGKCVVEKLLRGVPEVGRVIVLVRSKKGKSVRERVDSLLSSKVFDGLRASDDPSVLDKVVAVPGDLMLPGLGLSKEDLEMLVNSVSVVFHLAATINFDAPMREALQMNVVAVREVIKMCRKMKKLAALVHVSTAYAHCNRSDCIEEVVYPPKVNHEHVLGLLDWMTDDQLAVITPSLLNGRPNTYTYTKALAETVLATEGQGLPIAVFRPSIVGGAYQEPLPGWVDVLHGAAGIFIAVGMGILRTMKINAASVADIVPVDLATNAIVSVGWVTALSPTSSQPIVYNYTTGSVNPFIWQSVYPHLIRCYLENPFDQVFRRPWGFECRPRGLWPFWNFLLHTIPGFLADVMLRLRGKKPRMLQIYSKINVALEKLEYFTDNDWNWTYRNCDRMLSLMSEEDAKMFVFDLRVVDWEKYIKIFCLGTKCYILKEDVANLPVARKRLRRLNLIHYVLNLTMLLVATRLIYLRSQVARKLWGTVLQFCLSCLAKLGIPLA